MRERKRGDEVLENGILGVRISKLNTYQSVFVSHTLSFGFGYSNTIGFDRHTKSCKE